MLLEKLSLKKETKLETFIEDVNCAMKLRQCKSNIMPLTS